MNPTAKSPTTTPALDSRGHVLPLTPEQRRARTEAVRRFLDDVANSADEDPPGSDEEFMRAVDSHRPHRPLFEGMY